MKKKDRIYKVTIDHYFCVPEGIMEENLRCWFLPENLNREHAARHYYEVGGSRLLNEMKAITLKDFRARMDLKRKDIQEREQARKIYSSRLHTYPNTKH